MEEWHHEKTALRLDKNADIKSFGKYRNEQFHVIILVYGFLIRWKVPGNYLVYAIP